jgi:hypothetical protein
MTAMAIGGTLFSAFSSVQQGKAQAKAIAQEGAIAADNKAQETLKKAGAARASFLNSGFDLFGTPENSIGNIFDTGQSDIGRIISNANRGSKSAVSEGFSKAVGTIGKSFAAAGFGAAGGGAGGGVGGTSTSMGDGWKFSSGSMSGTNIGNDMPWL